MRAVTKESVLWGAIRTISLCRQPFPCLHPQSMDCNESTEGIAKTANPDKMKIKSYVVCMYHMGVLSGGMIHIIYVCHHM